jgi:hypothetical protein
MEAFLKRGLQIIDLIEEVYLLELESLSEFDLLDQFVSLNKALHDYNLKQLIPSSLLHELTIQRHLLWQKLHSVHWLQTPRIFRSLYGIYTIFLVLLSAQNSSKSTNWIRKLIQICDLGLLLCNEDSRILLAEILESLIREANYTMTVEDLISQRRRRQQQQQPHHLIHKSISYPPLPKCYLPIKGQQIEIRNQLSINEFADYFHQSIPVMIINAVEDWPCFADKEHHNWQDLSYILSGKNK